MTTENIEAHCPPSRPITPHFISETSVGSCPSPAGTRVKTPENWPGCTGRARLRPELEERAFPCETRISNSRYDFTTSRRNPPELLPEFSSTLQSEGAGNAGRRCAAAKSVHVVTTVTPESPGIPRAMVLRFPSCSPRRSGSFATVTCGTYRKLDTSVEVPGPHDFTVRSKHRPSRAPLRPPHPAPTSVTFAKRPSEWNGMRWI
jgi:hypothetical protein